MNQKKAKQLLFGNGLWVEYEMLKPSLKTPVKHVYLATLLSSGKMILLSFSFIFISLLFKLVDETFCLELLLSLPPIALLLSLPWRLEFDWLLFAFESWAWFLASSACFSSSVLGSTKWIENVWPSLTTVEVMNIFPSKKV